MKKISIFTLSITLALLGCNEGSKKTKKEELPKNVIEVIDEHTAEIALDWDGTYKGLLPCGSCPGILTTVKLNDNKTFEKSDIYLESKEGYINDKGTFSFSENGSQIILKSEKETAIYAVGENRLIFLDKNGKEAASGLSEMYTLNKMSNNEVEFSQELVKGALTFGHEVSVFEPCGSSKVYWVNDFSDGRLNKIYTEKTKNYSAPYTPVMAELILQKSDRKRQGFAEEYDDVVNVIEIKSVEQITSENFCTKKDKL